MHSRVTEQIRKMWVEIFWVLSYCAIEDLTVPSNKTWGNVLGAFFCKSDSNYAAAFEVS